MDGNKNYMLFFGDAGGSARVKCRQGSLGVVLLTCYAGPTVGAGVGSVLPVGQKIIRCKRSIWLVRLLELSTQCDP